MEKKLPKNVRQIGNVSDNPKIYVEDYVDTFLIQLSEKAKEVPMGAFFVGEVLRRDDGDYIFVSGAIQMHTLEKRGDEVIINDKTWKKACEEAKEFFEGKTILGWCLLSPEMQLKLNNNLIKIHERIFMKKSRLFMMKNSTEKEEAFFIYKYNDLMRVSGYYIYYEKNPTMQEYMISKRKQNCVTPSESCEDRVTKDFRSIVRENEIKKASKSKGRFKQVASLALVLAMVVVGVIAFDQYEEMKVVDTGEKDSIEVVIAPQEDGQELGPEKGEQPVIEGAAQEDKLPELSGIEDEEVENEKGISDNQSEESGNVVGNATENTVENGQGDEVVEMEYERYTVVEGDTLVRISEKRYGSIEKVDEISAINGLDDSDYIYIGQQLLLP